MAAADLRKAAVLLMSLPEPRAAELLGRLTPQQAETIAGEIAGLRGLARGEREVVMREFAAAVENPRVQSTGSAKTTDKTAKKTDKTAKKTHQPDGARRRPRCRRSNSCTASRRKTLRPLLPTNSRKQSP